MANPNVKQTPEVSTPYRGPLHPGAVIKRRLFDPLNLSQKEFCERHNINETRFSRILNGHQKITADTAIDLAKAFGLSEMFFMNLQNRHDIEEAKRRSPEGIGRGD